MNILITGGAGFIGSHLVDHLLSLGHRVRVLDNLDAQVHPGRTWPESLLAHFGPDEQCLTQLQDSAGEAVGALELVRGDVRDDPNVLSALEMDGAIVDVVVHLAAKVGVGQAEYQIAPYVETNTQGTAVVLQSILRLAERKSQPPPRIFVAGSMSAYGEGLYLDPQIGEIVRPAQRDPQLMEVGLWDHHAMNMSDEEMPEAVPLEPMGIREEDEFNGSGFYALTKGHQEELAIRFMEAYGAEVTVGRLFNVYGPRQALSNPYTGVAAIFANRFLAGEKPIVFEDGLQSRDFIYVQDVVEAITLLATGQGAVDGNGHPIAPQDVVGVYNVGTGIPSTLLEMTSNLAACMGCAELVPTKEDLPGTYRSGDIRHCYADISKLRALGWSPQVPLSTGLDLLADWTDDKEGRHGLQEQALRELNRFGRVSLPGGVDGEE